MSNTEYLESIIEEAQELLDAATAGGDKQYAFELMVSTSELHNAFNKLWDLGSRIREGINHD